MTLIDAGPVIGLIDLGDPSHKECLETARKLRIEEMATTWPCFVEAMYLLGSSGGFHWQERLWRIRREGRLRILETTEFEADRMSELMKIYQNVPMDLADASLVAVAESRGYTRLFTLDSDFYIYRLANGAVLEIIR